jgi:hypothetical protein
MLGEKIGAFSSDRLYVSACSLFYSTFFTAVHGMWDVVWENLRSLANYIPYLRTPDRAGGQVTGLNSTEMNYGSER